MNRNEPKPFLSLVMFIGTVQSFPLEQSGIDKGDQTEPTTLPFSPEKCAFSRLQLERFNRLVVLLCMALKAEFY